MKFESTEKELSVKVPMNLQKFAESKSGVFPCYENQFKVGATKEAATSIKDMETFSVAFDNGVEKWNPFDQEGWSRGLMTSKGITISVKGKRNIGDTGNDYVADKAYKIGRNAEGYFEWLFPDGTSVSWENAIFNITVLGSADATNVAPLEFEVNSNGKPTITPAV